MASDQIGSVPDTCFEVLRQSLAIDEHFLCGYRLNPSIDRYQSLPVNQFYRLIDWFSDHRFPLIGYPGTELIRDLSVNVQTH